MKMPGILGKRGRDEDVSQNKKKISVLATWGGGG